ncbi:MAG: carboxymuconolactone decarboxylase family protein [Desulfobulbaceae bacterium]|jgi:AhpD family alkylhydroperoxidase|nr:carboxymuconolactone decarboxylase family protein [Desulfobulbaceae bacterium]
MSEKKNPSFYKIVSKQFPEVMSAAAALGTTLRTAGPLDEKTTHLVQLAAAATMQSEGSVCSHTRRALEVGASPEEISHTLLLLITTIGFPQAMAALSWSQAVMEKKSNK